MAQLTRVQIAGEVEALIDLTGSEVRTSVNRYIDQAARRIWNAYPWPERSVESVVSTVAPYTTGTVTVTNASDALTGSGTTFTSAMVGRKFALGYGAPYYRISAYTSATALTLERNYLEATASTQAYTIFQDEYNLPSTYATLVDAALVLDGGRGPLFHTQQRILDAKAFITGSTGPPSNIALVNETSAGVRRARLWPIPDTTYGVRVRALKFWTDYTGDSDVGSLHQDREWLIVDGTCLYAQQLADAKKVITEEAFVYRLQQNWQNTQRRTPQAHRRQRYDAPTYSNRVYLDISDL